MMSKKTFTLVLVVTLLLVITGCNGITTDIKVAGSFTESKVPFPRISFHLRDNGNGSELYYIPISEETAEQCQDVLGNSASEEVKPHEYVQLFQLELDKERKVTVFETLTGGYYFSAGLSTSGIAADEVMEPLLELIEEATGQNIRIDIFDFKEVIGIKLLLDEKVVWESENPNDIARMCALLDTYQGSSASNFDNYDHELRCILTDGNEISLFLASDDGYIFIPPFRYYRLPAGSPLRDTGWLQLFGWDMWPSVSTDGD